MLQLLVFDVVQESVTEPPPIGREELLVVKELTTGVAGVMVNAGPADDVAQPAALQTVTLIGYVPGVENPIDAGVPVQDVALPTLKTVLPIVTV